MIKKHTSGNELLSFLKDPILKSKALVLQNFDNRKKCSCAHRVLFLFFSFKMAVDRDQQLGRKKCKIVCIFSFYLFNQKYLTYNKSSDDNDKGRAGPFY